MMLLDADGEVQETHNLFVQGQVTTGWSVDAIVEFLKNHLESSSSQNERGISPLTKVMQHLDELWFQIQQGNQQAMVWGLLYLTGTLLVTTSILDCLSNPLSSSKSSQPPSFDRALLNRKVELTGVTSKSELNGLQGVITEHKKGRFVVKLQVHFCL